MVFTVSQMDDTARASLDQCIREAVFDVAHARKVFCTKATNYYWKSLLVEVNSVKNSTCVYQNSNLDGIKCKYDLEAKQNELFPLQSLDDSNKIFTEIEEQVAKFIDEKDEILKVVTSTM
ncbi:uncharacterized protein LOC142318311 [Lycorma delicatula]|uniref:uncharacterized protein LOC142318311 n=1 Tax=Lycorma delicatula TaxID=130591 RepID=UPI003F510D89